MVEFDKILEDMGRLSAKQWFQLVVLMVPAVLVASHMGAMVYLGATVDYRCHLPLQQQLEENCNRTWSEFQTNLYIPNNTEAMEGCVRYDIAETPTTTNCSLWWPDDVNRTSLAPLGGKVSVLACDSWLYNTTLFTSTIMTEFDLVCSNSFKTHLAQAIFMLGVTLGCVFWGQIADSYGRINTIVISAALGTGFGVTVVFVKSYIIFVILRSISGFCLFAAFTSSYVLATEVVAPKHRVRIGQTEQSFFALGFCLLALYGYFIRSWRTLQLVLSVPVISLVTIYWLLFKSPRWLISQRRFKEANAIVQTLLKSVSARSDEADELKRIAEGEVDSKDEEEEQRTYGPIDLIRTPNMRKKSLNLFYNWLVCACVYYGLTLNSADLGGDPFINLFLSGFVEIPASCLAIVVIEKWGRRPSLSFTLISSGVACITMLFVPPQEYLWLNITLSMVGKFNIAAAFGVVYIFAAELYPTPIRNVGIGTCSSFARIGGILSPIIAMLDIVAKPLPYVVFGLMAIVGGILALLLPEVLGIRLPETLKEGEEFGLDQATPIQLMLGRCGCSSSEPRSPEQRVKYTTVNGADSKPEA